MNVLITLYRLRALEGILPRGKLGLTGPAGVGKTQYALTITAKLSHRYTVLLYTPEVYAVERLNELGANMKRVIMSDDLSIRADIRIIDDVTIYLTEHGIPKYKIPEFFLSIGQPALIISQIREPLYTPAISVPRIWRHVIDEWREFDGKNAYRRDLKRKKRIFGYRILTEGFTISQRSC